MSLGGRAFFGLNAAIRRAVRNQLIVTAAAGNCVGFVVAPAAYDETIAVGGTNINDSPWKGTSRGQAVDVSAPAEQVWVARRRKASDGQLKQRLDKALRTQSRMLPAVQRYG